MPEIQPIKIINDNYWWLKDKILQMTLSWNSFTNWGTIYFTYLWEHANQAYPTSCQKQGISRSNKSTNWSALDGKTFLSLFLVLRIMISNAGRHMIMRARQKTVDRHNPAGGITKKCSITWFCGYSLQYGNHGVDVVHKWLPKDHCKSLAQIFCSMGKALPPGPSGNCLPSWLHFHAK